MDQEIIVDLFAELRQDYAQYGKGQTAEAWLNDAIRRHFPSASAPEASAIANDLIKGISAYREQRTAIGTATGEKALAIDAIPIAERKKLAELTAFISDEILNDDDFDKIREVMKGEKKQ